MPGGVDAHTHLELPMTPQAADLAEVAVAPLYVVHLTSTDALEQVAWARHRGQNVFAETCPRYLYLTIEEHLDRPGLDGLRRDDLAVVSTDRCPFCDNEKLFGSDDFRATPNGLGAIEHRMDLIHRSRASSAWVETSATTPARLFGPHPRKGVPVPPARERSPPAPTPTW